MMFGKRFYRNHKYTQIHKYPIPSVHLCNDTLSTEARKDSEDSDDDDLYKVMHNPLFYHPTRYAPAIL